MDSPIDFREDGRIAIDIEGKPITLRNPKIREFKELLAYAEDLDDELKELEDITERIKNKDPKEPVTEDEMARWREIRASVASRFVHKSMTMLGDRKPPEDIEDLPSFTQDMTLPGRFQNHWQTVPLDSSRPPIPNR